MKASLLPLFVLLSPAGLAEDVDVVRSGATARQVERASVVRALCQMKAGDAPIRLISQNLTIRFSAYGPMELVAPHSCGKVAFYIRNRPLGIRYHRLMKAKEDKREYVFFAEVVVDGAATYDAEEGRVRIDIAGMAGLPDS